MSHVVLIGPIGVGKSTTAPLIATGHGCELLGSEVGRCVCHEGRPLDS